MLKSFLFGFFAYQCFYFYSMNVFPKPWQLGFQEPATAMMSGIIDLHHDVMAILAFILGFVSVMLLTILILFSERKILNQPFSKITLSRLHRNNYYSGHGITYHTWLETIWTIVPTLILLVIATPSFALIYALDEVMHPELTVRIAGRQWYWNYEYPDGLKQKQYFNRLPPNVGKNLDTLLGSVANRLQLDATSVISLKNDFATSSENNIHGFEVAKPPFDVLDWQYNPHFVWLMESTKKAFSWTGMAELDYNRRAGDFTTGPGWAPKGFLKNPNAAYVDISYPILKFNSYMIPTDDLPFGTFRLLEVDKRLVLPVDTTIRFLVTSDDVLHSWTVPSFGIKVDAVPGRTNEYYLTIQKCGVFYGQCSEICGVNHGFMPIKVEVVPNEIFRLWYLNALVCELEDDGETVPLTYEASNRAFFIIVDELIPYFCDLHGYEPIELHKKAVLAYFDGGFAVSRFLCFRHLIANIICNAFFKQDGYTLKPTHRGLESASQLVCRKSGLFTRFGFTNEYVEKYKLEDFDKASWSSRFPSNFYNEMKPGFEMFGEQNK